MDRKKEFIEKFKELARHRSLWETWSDLITIMALTISLSSNTVRMDERKKEYLELSAKYDKEKIAELIILLGTAYDENREQDFLGSIFMSLGLGDHWKGQYFTPYDVSKMMAKITNAKPDTGKRGFVSIEDPCCGAGAMLIAAANEIENYQADALFIGQDIDRMAGLMCYVQLSILGCAGYVCIANALTNPVEPAGDILPRENPGQEYWYMPGLNTSLWTMRIFEDYVKISGEGQAYEQRI